MSMEPQQQVLELDPMHHELMGTVEAVLFAAGRPLSMPDLRRIIARLYESGTAEFVEEKLAALTTVVGALIDRYANDNLCGFELVNIADGFAFRSKPRFSAAVQCLREEKPVRLSRASMETLAIVSYRQPVTKPDMDEIRGVDCGGTLKVLLERDLVRIVGKCEEPGRPLLYGTTKEFLTFFGLESLAHLPSLRDIDALANAVPDEVEDRASMPTLQELRAAIKNFDEPDMSAIDALDAAVTVLNDTEEGARTALGTQGVELPGGKKSVDDDAVNAA